MPGKPIVLHLGDAIKYNHDVYNEEFLSRFDVVQNHAETREEFIKALQHKRLVIMIYSRSKTISLTIVVLATSLPSSGHISRQVAKWVNGTTNS